MLRPGRLGARLRSARSLPPLAACWLQVCSACDTATTPMWRVVQGKVLCNKCGLRLKRRLGLL